MGFDILSATSESSLGQLFQEYNSYWQGDYTIVSLYNLWYYKDSVNNAIVNCRAYYKYKGLENGYWCNYMNYDTTNGLYFYSQEQSGTPATSTSSELTSADLELLTLYYPVPISNICFPAGTPITTNQGNIFIDNLIPSFHTISDKKIVGISKTITEDKYLVCFEKDALGKNIPSKKTIMSKLHCVFYQGKMIQSYNFIGVFKNVYKVKYSSEILYNVLMEEHDIMSVNNLICETLHPENEIAKLLHK